MLKEYGEVLKSKFAPQIAAPASFSAPNSSTAQVSENASRALVPRFAARLAEAQDGLLPSESEPIAIVGVSACFPGANDLDTFWKNLEQGTESIREIPSDRWDWRAVYGDPSLEPNRTNVKWGGFIENIWRFDSLFFGISPQEAELMDPPQRLLMTYGWMALEDAGYSVQSLSGSQAGVFVGVTNSGYTEMLVAANVPSQAYTSTGRVTSVGPNRLSYWLNWHGPSEPIETACSSSLVAIHRAVQSIRNGECEMALAGGVHTIQLPWIQISFDKAGMLSKDGHCRTFSSDANGYVRGEGAGMLFLKKLSAAQRDGDHIYAVIRGTAENHGGRANSLTAPNPKAQAEVIKAAFGAAGIHPGRVTYIEAHGTGTPLGDPAEINGLKKAFAEMSQEMPSASIDVAAGQCGLGSVKTNIGHLEVAAGVAGVVKVLLQMKHRKLVKNLHCEKINPYIQLEDSPFYIVRQSQPWPAKQDAFGRELPRVAGISSFGFGGVNAHVVLEEYVASLSAEPAFSPADELPSLIVLSARNQDRLREQVVCLKDHLSRHSYSDADVKHIAYTLQVGRDCWNSRLALGAVSIEELKTKLSAYLDGGYDGLYRGEVKRKKTAKAVEIAGNELQDAIDKAMTGDGTPLLNLWINGTTIDWSRLYVGQAGDYRRMSLPTYPFAPEMHRLVEGTDVKGRREPVACSHPLLERNTSNLEGLRFTTTFRGTEFFLADHVVRGKKVLPGVCYLEMARAAFAATCEGNLGTPVDLKDVVWIQPVEVSGSRDVHIGLTKGEAGEVVFRVYTGEDDGHKVVHAQGRIAILADAASSAAETQFDLGALEGACGQRFDQETCYAAFAATGLDYGPAHRGLSSVNTGKDSVGRYVVATIGLPSILSDTKNIFELHPSLADSALQAAVGFMLSAAPVGESQPSIPFALDRLLLLRRLPERSKVYVKECAVRNGTKKLDLHLCNDSGQVCASFIGLSLRMVQISSYALETTVTRIPADAKPSLTLPVSQIASAACPARIEESAIAEATTHIDLLRVIERELVEGVSKQLKIDASEIDVDAELNEFGLDSIGLTTLSTRLNQECGISIGPALFFEYTTIRAFAGYLANEYPAKFQARRAIAAHAAPAAKDETPAANAASAPTSEEPSAEVLHMNIEHLLIREISKQLKIDASEIDVEADLSDFGLDSIGLTTLGTRLSQERGIAISPALFFEYTTIRAFAGYLADEHPTKFQTGQPTATHVQATATATPVAPAWIPALPRKTPADASAGELRTKVEELLVREMSGQLMIDASEIDAEANLSDLGLDSIGLTSLSAHLQEACGVHISPPVFFEYATIRDFSGYLVQEHLDPLRRYFRGAPVRLPETVNVPEPQPALQTSLRPASSNVYSRHIRASSVQSTDSALSREQVAIIGMSGRFPGANTLEDFWENLKWGTDSIQEIPLQRWDWRAIYGDPHMESKQSFAKWGGFLDGIDEFDPFFFGISPKEAASMDPRQRLLMSYGWKAIEDAGYSAQALSGSRTGVFAGTSISDYSELLTHSNAVPEGFAPIGLAGSLGPNRLSSWMNWHGPSEAIDTACSSSLVAIHRAVRAIQGGECETALAGGVNTIITPWLQVAFSKAGMLSPDGRCKTFSKHANGYVRGEGIGMLLLKPLSVAKRDGDHIYATIRSSAVNHGGRAASLTAPNPKLQAEVIKKAYQDAGVDPRNVTYIEAHGTGTPLGDPIEINGLKIAFGDLCENLGLARNSISDGHCGIGSVKTNIGHLELAAGVAGVIKVLLQMKHGTLARSLHCEEQNPYIELEHSPFFIVKETQPWLSPANAQGGKLPRIAGVSSFGFGGANAHVVLEEYCEEPAAHMPASGNKNIVLLSAKSADRLREQARQLHENLARGSYSDSDLCEIAYTLQVGRDAMESRIAFTARSIHEAEEKLASYLAGNEANDEVKEFCSGQIRRNSSTGHDASEETHLLLENQAASGDYGKLLEQWVQGSSFDWKKLYAGQQNQLRRLSLPTYPFSKERYWADPCPAVLGNDQVPVVLHPLLHRNTSTLSDQRFSTLLKEGSILTKDHVVDGRKLLPAVCCVEMARAAVAASSDSPRGGQIEMSDLLWLHPADASRDIELHIRLGDADAGEIDFEIYSESGDGEIVYATGRAANRSGVGSLDNLAVLDIPSLQAGCVETLAGAECYRRFETAGIAYGPAYQGLDKISRGSDSNGIPYVLAGVHLPESSLSGDSEFVLHPSVLDSALQATLGLMPAGLDGGAGPLLVPFSLDAIRIADRTPQRGWAYVRPAASLEEPAGRKFDLEISDEAGRVCISLRGLFLRELTQMSALANTETMLPVNVQPAERFLREGSIAALKRMMSAATNLAPEQFDENELLEKYGIDSIFVLKLHNQLSGVLPGLKSTVFFDHRTLASLAGYLVMQHTASVRRWLGLEGDTAPTQIVVPDNSLAAPKLPRARAFSRRGAAEDGFGADGRVEVAIVGMSGRYPQSANVEEFWENLVGGRNCISEIPLERWDWKRYYDKEKGVAGRMYSRWGGFIDGIDKFDPFFFRLSPAEAERMDPQERIFLEEAFACIEDAGYTVRNICSTRKVGVYAGVMNSTYAPNATHWSIANRVSYLFDFQGPSMAVDTACSSSLTALHLAVEAIRNHECEVAMVGGINLIVDPVQFLDLSEMTMLSNGDRCRAFGAHADGFVDGEGAGAVLLKPLQQAIAGGDHIYGIIKATAVNAGGKTNGYTVPNPTAQSNVIREAIRKAGVDSRAIGYIEAHGTGTELGDPIEVEGLSRAFASGVMAGQSDASGQRCAIGSVKSNIGHLESAAGIAGLTKVLLQMKYQTLVPSLDSEELNPHIDFASTPFCVQQSASAWKRSLIEVNSHQTEIPLLAGISSFGAGGANAHVIVEEYRMDQFAETVTPIAFTPERPAIIVLSARSYDQLRQQVHRLHHWLTAHPLADADLASLAFTLQVGREAMEYRLALTVTSVQQLAGKLSACLQGNFEKVQINGCYYGQLKRSGESAWMFSGDDDLKALTKSWLENGKYSKCLEYWVRGLALDWNLLYRHSQVRPRRLSLPTYPFAQERCWMRRHIEAAVASKPLPAQIPFENWALDDVLDRVLNGELEVSQAAKHTEEVLREVIS